MEKLLILDLDETLIYATDKGLERDCDFKTSFYFVYKRPFLDEFLSFCFSNFKVAIWTSAGKVFADEIVKVIIEKHGTPEFVWSNKKCTPRFNPETYEIVETKNLAKVKNKGFPLDLVIMVDDTPEKLSRNYGNLVRVKEFTGQKEDSELKILIRFLLDLKSVQNIRKIEKRGWQRKYLQHGVQPDVQQPSTPL